MSQLSKVLALICWAPSRKLHPRRSPLNTSKSYNHCRRCKPLWSQETNKSKDRRFVNSMLPQAKAGRRRELPIMRTNWVWRCRRCQTYRWIRPIQGKMYSIRLSANWTIISSSLVIESARNQIISLHAMMINRSTRIYKSLKHPKIKVNLKMQIRAVVMQVSETKARQRRRLPK